jgi:hypothetical protein
MSEINGLFTAEDVKTVRWLVRRVGETLPEDGETDVTPHLQAQIDGHHIANRIETMLAPESAPPSDPWW